MSAAGRGLVASALAAAESWLLEPAEAAERPLVPPPSRSRSRGVLAVFGLGPRRGATVVARALGAELAARDASGACVIAGGEPGRALPLATPAARRLTRALPGAATASGRLCLHSAAEPISLGDLTRALAPLVLDAGAAPGGAEASAADSVVLVATPAVEPALAEVVSASVARVAAAPIVVLNRVGPAEPLPGEPWEGRADLLVPESRAGAGLAVAGRAARGAMGEAIAELADRCAPPMGRA